RGAAGGDDPTGRAGRALAERGRSYAGGVEAPATLLLRTLQAERLRLLKGGASDPQHPAFLPADFGQDGLYKEEGNCLLGVVAALPAGHWGRAILAEDGLYKLSTSRGVVRTLVLGGEGEESDEAADVIALTKDWRSVQRHREDEAQRRREAEEQLIRAEAMSNPTARLRRLEDQVEQLRLLLAAGEASP